MRLIFILLVFLVGCAPAIRPTCVPRSLFQAVGVQQEMKIPTRIVISRSSVKGVHHAQAQAFYKGKWVWLEQDGDVVILSGVNDNGRIDNKYRPLVPIKYLTIRQLMEESYKRGIK